MSLVLHTVLLGYIIRNEMSQIQQPVHNQEKELSAYNNKAAYALQLVDDIVLKKYLTRLENGKLLPLPEDLRPQKGSVRLFKINKMVYEKNEYATDKFISMVGAMTYTNNTIFLILDGHKDHTDFYLGIKADDSDNRRTPHSIADTFVRAISGQFPGAELSCAYESDTALKSDQERLFERIKGANAISLCVGLPAYKNEKSDYTNANYIQGIEKLALAMQGKEYTAVILATCVDNAEVHNLRQGYENIYSDLSTMATQQVAYSSNESLANTLTRTKGYSEVAGHTRSVSESKTNSSTVSFSEGESGLNNAGKCGRLITSISTPLTQVGSILLATGAGAHAGAIMLATGALLGVVSNAVGMNEKQLSKNHSESKTEGTTIQTSESESYSHTDQYSDAEGQTSTIGSSKNITLTIENKHIKETLKLIDKQLERIEKSEGLGLWSSGAYFISYAGDNAGAEIGASIFRSIMQGEQSGVEVSAINSWISSNDSDSDSELPENEKQNNIKLLGDYIQAFVHPMFRYEDSDIIISASSLISSKELAMMIGLPRKSVPGLPVTEHISLAKEVVRFSKSSCNNVFNFGHVFDQGIERKQVVNLDANSLTKHVFVSGSTGSGKSETVYALLCNVRKNLPDVKFLIIEPAKGEYKNVFGNPKKVKVYGSNPLKHELLKINPFKFPSQEIHVLEHIDRLVEIFNVCWPMYAAMPAVLKDAMLCAYEKCGWDLSRSTNTIANNLFPTFADLQNQLIDVINNSGYSEEVKSNYIGSLVTRVKSLTNGINGEIFSGQELGDHTLFDENVIVDLSRVGSQETKALIMGILVMRLNEHRSACAQEANSSLKHITVLEEAHHILKKCSQEQSMEGSNVAGKAVEMLSNSIAEMRTFGEGFIIVDQSPNAVDISAIRNTNTKIIMRLPEENDRRVAGKAAAMKDDQIDEIAILPTGVAVVYQNDWEAPVLCKIDMYDGDRHRYPSYAGSPGCNNQASLVSVLDFLLAGRIKNKPHGFELEKLSEQISSANISTESKIQLYFAIKEFRTQQYCSLWEDRYFPRLASIVTTLLSAKEDVVRYAKTEPDFAGLTSALFKLIEIRVPSIPICYKKTIAQCLMRDYSLSGGIREQIYAEWLSTVSVNKIVN